MYKHILVPTDGSALSRKAVRTAVRMAKSGRARVTGLYVVPPYAPMLYGEGVQYAPFGTRKEYRKALKAEARKALAPLNVEARAAGIASAQATVTNPAPWQGILSAARSRRCDLIVMASHGRRGVAGLLLGSETHKVLTHSKIPVLVCR